MNFTSSSSSLFSVLLLLLVCVLFFDSCSAIVCYHASRRTSSRFPSDAKEIRCRSDEFCLKVYDEAYYVLHHGEAPSKVVLYSWGCFTPKIPFRSCGATYEYTYTSSNTAANSTHINYLRSCSCCGDRCNDASMDGQCNEAPVFNKQCYAASRSTDQDGVEASELPGHAALVNCSSATSCYKAFGSNGVNSLYMWGCAALADVACGQGLMFPTRRGPTAKWCSCCGSKCNGATVDWLTVNATSCDRSLDEVGEFTFLRSSNGSGDVSRRVAGLAFQSLSSLLLSLVLCHFAAGLNVAVVC